MNFIPILEEYSMPVLKLFQEAHRNYLPNIKHVLKHFCDAVDDAVD
jgi:hypothetical protein